MKHNQLKSGDVSMDAAGVGTITPAMVHHRAAEIALINGRSPQNILDSDWEQARRELSGRGSVAARELTLENAPESERWEPVGGSEGRKVSTVSNDDEDDEGRTDNERLVEEGMAEAEHSQMVQATKQAAKRDRI